MIFTCNTCGDQDYPRFMGSEFSDEFKEDLVFIADPNGNCQVLVDDPIHFHYWNMQDAKQKERWLKQAREFLAKADAVICPNCQEDCHVIAEAK